MRRTVPFLLGLTFVFLCGPAFAVPATVNVTVTSITDPVPDASNQYRLHQACDDVAQTVGPVLADPVVIGTQYSFQGDTDSSYSLCVVGYNAAGEGPQGPSKTISFSGVVIPPGAATFDLTCTVDAASGGSTVIATCVQN